MRFRLLFQCWLTVIVLLGTFSANAWADELNQADVHSCWQLFFTGASDQQPVSPDGGFPGIKEKEAAKGKCTRFGMRVDNGNAVVFSPVVSSKIGNTCDGDENALVHGENKEPVWCGSIDKAKDAPKADWSPPPHQVLSPPILLPLKDPDRVEEEIKAAILNEGGEGEIEQLGLVWRHAFFKSVDGDRLPVREHDAQDFEWEIDGKSRLGKDIPVQIGELHYDESESEMCRIFGTWNKVTTLKCDGNAPTIGHGDQKTFTFFLFDHTRNSTAKTTSDGGYLVKGSIEVTIPKDPSDEKVPLLNSGHLSQIPNGGDAGKENSNGPKSDSLLKAFVIFIVVLGVALGALRLAIFFGSRKRGKQSYNTTYEQKPRQGEREYSKPISQWPEDFDHGGHVKTQADFSGAQSPDPQDDQNLRKTVRDLEIELSRAQRDLQDERRQNEHYARTLRSENDRLQRELDNAEKNLYAQRQSSTQFGEVMTAEITALKGEIDQWKQNNEKTKGLLARSEHDLKDTNKKLSIFEDEKRIEDERKRNVLARPVVQGLTEQVLLVSKLPVLRKAVDELNKAVDSGEQGTSVVDQLQAGIEQVEEVLEQARNLGSVPVAYLQAWNTLLQEARMGQQTYRLFLGGVSRNRAFEKEGVLRMIEHSDFSASDSDTAKGAFKAWSDVLRVPPDTPNDDGLEMAKTFQREVVQKWLWPTIRLLKFVAEALPVEVPSLAANIRTRPELNTMANGSTLFCCQALLKDLKFEWDPIALYQHSLGDFTQYSNVDQGGVSWDEVGKGLPFPEGVEPGIICRVGMLRIIKAPNDCWFANAKILAVRG